jgi:hypothetical protein
MGVPHGKAVGWQMFASQHAGALGDLQTNSGEVPDVIGNLLVDRRRARLPLKTAPASRAA